MEMFLVIEKEEVEKLEMDIVWEKDVFDGLCKRYGWKKVDVINEGWSLDDKYYVMVLEVL